MADTELWLVDLTMSAAALEALEAATPRLADDLLQRLAAMGDAGLRRERRLAHIALRLLLERRLGPGVRRVAFATNASGKPSLPGAGPEASFSLAHTRGVALIGLGPAPLGVDIERARPVRMTAARRAPIEAEAVALAGGAPLADTGADARFLGAWARLEAAAKAQGRGVAPVLERLRPNRTAGADAPAPPPGGAGEAVGPPLRVHDIPVPAGLFAAVALDPGAAPPPLLTLPGTAEALAALLAAGPGTRR